MEIFLVVIGIAYFIGCLALGGWLASEKGYSVGSWVILLILFGVLALIVLVGAPDRKNQISTAGTSLGNASSGSNSNSIYSSNAPPINRNYGDTWVCKKCNETNPISSSMCKGCGEYK